MIRAFQMIFAPEGAWQGIVEKNRNFLFVLFASTLPLLAGALALEGLGLERLGQYGGELGRMRLPREVIVRYELIQLGLSLALVFGGGAFLRSMANSFNARVSFSLSFNTIAYGSSAIFLMRAVDGIPQIPTWVCWGIGAVLAVRSLYHGIAIHVRPEQTKGMGLFIVAAFIVIFLSGLAHFLALSALQLRPV